MTSGLTLWCPQIISFASLMTAGSPQQTYLCPWSVHWGFQLIFIWPDLASLGPKSLHLSIKLTSLGPQNDLIWPPSNLISFHCDLDGLSVTVRIAKIILFDSLTFIQPSYDLIQTPGDLIRQWSNLIWISGGLINLSKVFIRPSFDSQVTLLCP